MAIAVDFTRSKEVTTSDFLTQWATGQTITVTGLTYSGTLYARCEIVGKSQEALCTKCTGSSGGTITVKLPDPVLAMNGIMLVNLTAETSTAATTVASIRVPVHAASKPTDWTPGSDYVVTIDGLLTRAEADSARVEAAVASIPSDYQSGFNQLSGEIAELRKKTRNLLTVTHPEFLSTNTAQTLVDFGENRTFPNGICASFDAIGMSVVAATAGYFFIENEDGTKTYCTLNQCRLLNEMVAVPNHSGGTITDRVFTDAAGFKGSVTFRKFCVYHASTRMTGSFGNFQLTSGTYPTTYIAPCSADDKVLNEQNGRSNVEAAFNALNLSIDTIKFHDDVCPNNIAGYYNFVKQGVMTSDPIPCAAGDTLLYTLSQVSGYPMIMVFDSDMQVNSIVSGTGQVNYATGSYTFASTDAYFIVSCATDLKGHYSLSYDNGSGHSIEQMYEEISSAKSRITAIDGGSVPYYWESELAASANAVNELQCSGSDVTSFVFVTDTHWGNNAKNSPKLIKEICDRCYIPVVLHGGDVTTGASNESILTVCNCLIDETNAFSRLHGKMLRCEGNHDASYTASAAYDSSVSSGMFYNVFFRWQNGNIECVTSPNGRYSYMDDKQHKVRYISLNKHDLEDNESSLLKWTHYSISNAQFEWLANVALKGMDSDWCVVILTHEEAWSGAGYLGLRDIIRAFNRKQSGSATYTGAWDDGVSWERSVSYDFTGSDSGGSIIFLLHGHDHVDSMAVSPYSLVYDIATANDSLGVTSGAPSKTLGTETEQLFDVFTINKATKTVNITRVGAGEDRSFSFDYSS